MTTPVGIQDPVLRTADYVLSRLTSYFGNRPEQFRIFMDGNVKAEGWLPAEAYAALSGPVSRSTVKVNLVRGKAQGSDKFDPDLELDINKEFHQLAVVPVLTSADEPMSVQVEKRLASYFQWLTGPLAPRAMLYVLAWPASTDDADWKAAIAKAQSSYNAKPFGQMQFVIPRPPRPMVRAAAAMFLPASRVPAEPARARE
ncbi:MAG: hypothetical protein HY680_07320 [Chloroflexi bacterium]|nr:hypothetical protein [Chloroflexota bacterium]